MFAGFYSGSGHVPPNRLRRAIVRHGFLLGVFMRRYWNQAIQLLCQVFNYFVSYSIIMPPRSGRGAVTFHRCNGQDSPQLEAVFDLFRLVAFPCGSLETFRQPVLACISPSLPEVSWTAVKLGGVPGWRASSVGHVVSGSSLKVAVVYLHGGGLCGGDAGGFQGLVSRLAFTLKRPVWLPHYRLCPEHTKEEAVEDVIRFLSDMSRELHQDASADALDFILVADSAGAYAAHAACQDSRLFRKAPPRESGNAYSLEGRVRLLCCYSPMLGLVDLEEGRLASGGTFGTGRATLDALDAVDPVTPCQQLKWCYKLARICTPEPVLKKQGPYAARHVLVCCALNEVLYADSAVYADALEKSVPGVQVERRFLAGKHLHGIILLAGLGVPEVEAEFEALVRRIGERVSELEG